MSGDQPRHSAIQTGPRFAERKFLFHGFYSVFSFILLLASGCVYSYPPRSIARTYIPSTGPCSNIETRKPESCPEHHKPRAAIFPHVLIWLLFCVFFYPFVGLWLCLFISSAVDCPHVHTLFFRILTESTTSGWITKQQWIWISNDFFYVGRSASALRFCVFFYPFVGLWLCLFISSAVDCPHVHTLFFRRITASILTESTTSGWITKQQWIWISNDFFYVGRSASAFV
jgi:hypothetical protein